MRLNSFLKNVNSFALDLRRFRSYRGELVRDLLRAIRNKVCVYLTLNCFLFFEMSFQVENPLSMAVKVAQLIHTTLIYLYRNTIIVNCRNMFGCRSAVFRTVTSNISHLVFHV